MFKKSKQAKWMDFKPGVKPGDAKVTRDPSAASFPAVGVTLPTYKGGPRRRAGRAAKAGRFRSKITKKRVALVICAVILAMVGWLGWKFIYNEYKIFGGNLFGLFNSTKLRGEDVGRVNILLAGNSADDVGHNGGTLTDSIMIVSIDTRNHQAYMISIPRDLWVYIPGNGHSKINAAYVYGQSAHFAQAGYPRGGMGLLEKTIEETFKIPINYYALINYGAFRDAVNAVGGIDITVNSDDPRGLYDPSIDWSTGGPLVNLSNGRHHLNGEQALDLARARGDDYRSYGFPQSDFDRTKHQRQMLVALKDKIMSSSTLANPIKLGKLLDAFGNNVRTDFKPSEIHRLYDLSKDIKSSSIKSLSLNNINGKDLLASCKSGCQGSALIPAAGLDDFSQIDLYLKRLLSNDPVVKESAKIVLLNATNTYGLASKNSDKLEDKGVTVTNVADAKQLASRSRIIDNSHGKKPATRRLLKDVYGDNVTRSNPYASTYTKADFIIILGQDQVTY